MPQPELLKAVLDALRAAGVEYMVTGSLASSMQGAPRSTHDVDLVVAMASEAAPHLLRTFSPPNFYLSAQAIADAVKNRTMFNLLSLTDGEKVDFWMLTDEPFDQSRFTRRRLEEILDTRLFVSAPEDTILAKLRWAKQAGGSEKQFKDALNVYEVQFPHLDMTYLQRWVTELGVEDLWTRLCEQAKPPS